MRLNTLAWKSKFVTTSKGVQVRATLADDDDKDKLGPTSNGTDATYAVINEFLLGIRTDGWHWEAKGVALQLPRTSGCWIADEV